MPPGEGFFLPCSFWLADNLALCGRHAEAEALFERLLALRNDVGLLSEEYDLRDRRALGNIPQALTHVALINTARNLSQRGGPSEHRSRATAPASRPAARRRRQPPKAGEAPSRVARRHQCCRLCTIHDTPKRSATMPKRGEKNVFVSGICTCPPLASALNA